MNKSIINRTNQIVEELKNKPKNSTDKNSEIKPKCKFDIILEKIMKFELKD